MGIWVNNLEESTNNLYFVSRFLFFPLCRRHSGAGLEGSEEGLLVAEAHLVVDGADFLVGIFEEQAFSVFNAIIVDKLVERVALAVDGCGHDIGMDSQFGGDILYLEVAVQVELLLFH